jgi:RNA polymerase sigma-70 factor (ECF subfamily)
LDDHELVQKLIAKDEKAYRYFYDTYRDKLYKACVYLLGYRDPDAEDITHDVLMAAISHLPQFEFRSSLYHWLYRICMYRCFERIRQRNRQVASLHEELEGFAAPHAAFRQSREREEKEKERLLDLMETQRELMGEPCKSLLDLREKEGKSYAQIADRLKVPIGTVMSRLSRCKETLRELVLRAWKEVTRG